MTLHLPIVDQSRRPATQHNDLRPVPSAREAGLASEFHRWPLPGYIWPALERRYHSIFCSEPQLRIHGGLTSQIEAWVCRRNGHISILILFERCGRHAHVLNEVFDVSAQELREFADAVFAHHRELLAIVVRAAFFEPSPDRYLCLSSDMSDDYQLSLTSTIDEWMSSLSSRTREKIRSQLRRAQRHCPNFCFRTIASDAIEESQLRRVIDFNRARMKVKRRRFGMTALDERNLCRMMRERGLLSVIEIDGEIRAGLLCTLAGDDITMHVIAHDPAFDDLRLGFLCCVLTIEHAISRRLRCLHFLWGRYDYKTRLGGERKVLKHVLLLRGPIAVLTQPKLLVFHLCSVLRAWLRQRHQARQG